MKPGRRLGGPEDMADQTAPTGKTKRVGGAGATAIPERNDKISGADNGFIADERRPTAKAGVIWKEDAQGQPALPGKAGRKTIGATGAATDDSAECRFSERIDTKTLKILIDISRRF